MSTNSDLLQIYTTYSKCEACKFAKNRRKIFMGVGNPNASILFILDKTHYLDILNDTFLPTNSPYRDILSVLFEMAGASWKDYYYTPATLCPSASLPQAGERPLEQAPAPKPKEVRACTPRIQEELFVIAPLLVVCFGQVGVRSLIPTDAPSLHYNLGEIQEGTTIGEFGTYPVPVMLTNSLQSLLAQPDMSENGAWAITASHIKNAIRITKVLQG